MPARAAEQWGALADVVFRHLGQSDGLPSPVAMGVAEDRDGFLWVATGDGLARWDGYRMRIYRPHPRVAGALPDNFVQALHADPQGGLWIGTGAAGLARYDQSKDDFVPYGIEGAMSGRIEIRTMCDDGAGGLWVVGGGGLYHLDPGATALRHASVPGLPDAKVLAVLRDRRGGLWVGTEHGLFRQISASADFTKIRLNTAGVPIVSLLQDHAGHVWAGTVGAGVFRIDADGANSVQPPNAPALGVSLQTLDVESLVEARPGELWLGTGGSGIVALDARTLAARGMRHDMARPTSLADDTVWALYRDGSGLIWAATDHGLSRADPARSGLQTLFSAPGHPDRISDPDVNALFTDPNGHVWLGLTHGGLDMIDPQAGRVVSVASPPGVADAIVDAMAGGPAGMFIGTYHGLFEAGPAGRISRIPMPGEDPMRAATALALDGQTLWIGAGNGVDRLRPDRHSVEQVIDGSRLTDRRVRVLLPDGSGRLWIGSWDGLSLYDPATDRIVLARTDALDLETLAPGAVTTLLLDHQKRLWVGTGGGGISVLTGRRADGTLRFRRLGTEDGLPNQTVDTLLQGRDGQIWASTDDGIARIDPDTLRIAAFHMSDGIALPVYWANSGAISREGALLFGGPGGMTVVHPDGLTASAHPGRLVITDIQAGGQERPLGLINEAAQAAPLVLRPDHNILSVEFSSLDFVDPERTRYEYRLEGLDRGWIQTDATRRLAAYGNLPPGEFTLRIRGVDADGNFSDAERHLAVTVLPAWYQTIWARIGAGIFTAVGILGIGRLQSMRLRARQHELEAIVTSRTAELRHSNEALTHAAAILSDLGAIGQQITANLDLETVCAVMHRNVARLLDAPHFAIYLMRATSQHPELRFGMRDGAHFLCGDAACAAHDDLVLQAMRERREIVSPPTESGLPANLICAPLIALDRVIGVMLIESPHVHAYGDRERLIFRSLCAYGAIALGNAETLMALAEMRAQLEHLAYTDGLTNLPNRRVYIEQFDRFAARAQEGRENFALLLIDIDRFKDINDNYGHDAGDALLAATASRLQASVRGTDIVIRLGGDEFAILLSDVEGQVAVEHACSRILAQFDVGLDFKQDMIEASVSIGAAIFPVDGDTQEHLYKAADLALYQAKRAGRATWRRFESTRVSLEAIRAQLQAD